MKAEKPITQKIKLIYFTDPICSSCWGIEPQLRKLKLEYPNSIDIEYRMGGLLPDWSYRSGGIQGPSDVATHWDEASKYYDMPIDGDIWIEDPLPSSYPPSIAFKAAQAQDPAKAEIFLREMRELLFLKKKNITKWEHIAFAAQHSDLDVDRLKKDVEGTARRSFEADLELARAMGVRGFPTLFLVNQSGQQERIYGSQPYARFEESIQRLDPSMKKQPYPRDWESLFSVYPSLSSKEFAALSQTPREKADEYLQRLHEDGMLNKWETKNGPMWKRK